MTVRETNRARWDALVDKGNVWTVPVASDAIARARTGDFRIVLTPTKPVPRAWFDVTTDSFGARAGAGPRLDGLDVLCLASGGGQQGPLLAAAGARVTVFDNSPKQLGQDRLVAAREKLAIDLVEGDMRDLSAFAAESFDVIVHPCSNCFVPDVRPVWREAARVLRRGGALLAGIVKPIAFAFDPYLEKSGTLTLRYSIPYSDLTSITDEEREKLYPGEPLSFGHTLEDQLGGQIDAGLALTGLYEDRWDEAPINKYLSAFLATRASKLG